MKSVIFLVSFYASFSALAAPENVEQLGSPDYIEVTKVSKNYISFQMCNKLTKSCYKLGQKRFYKIRDLQSQRVYEYLQSGGALLADVGVVIVTALVGAEIGGGLAVGEFFYGAALGSTEGAIGGLIGLGAGGVADVYFDTLNPAYQFKQARVVSDEVLNDERVITSDIKSFARKLEEVLEKI